MQPAPARAALPPHLSAPHAQRAASPGARMGLPVLLPPPAATREKWKKVEGISIRGRARGERAGRGRSKKEYGTRPAFFLDAEHVSILQRPATPSTGQQTPFGSAASRRESSSSSPAPLSRSTSHSFSGSSIASVPQSSQPSKVFYETDSPPVPSYPYNAMRASTATIGDSTWDVSSPPRISASVTQTGSVRSPDGEPKFAPASLVYRVAHDGNRPLNAEEAFLMRAEPRPPVTVNETVDQLPAPVTVAETVDRLLALQARHASAKKAEAEEEFDPLHPSAQSAKDQPAHEEQTVFGDLLGLDLSSLSGDTVDYHITAASASATAPTHLAGSCLLTDDDEADLRAQTGAVKEALEEIDCNHAPARDSGFAGESPLARARAIRASLTGHSAAEASYSINEDALAAQSGELDSFALLKQKLQALEPPLDRGAPPAPACDAVDHTPEEGDPIQASIRAVERALALLDSLSEGEDGSDSSRSVSLASSGSRRYEEIIYGAREVGLQQMSSKPEQSVEDSLASMQAALKRAGFDDRLDALAQPNELVQAGTRADSGSEDEDADGPPALSRTGEDEGVESSIVDHGESSGIEIQAGKSRRAPTFSTRGTLGEEVDRLLWEQEDQAMHGQMMRPLSPLESQADDLESVDAAGYICSPSEQAGTAAADMLPSSPGPVCHRLEEEKTAEVDEVSERGSQSSGSPAPAVPKDDPRPPSPAPTDPALSSSSRSSTPEHDPDLPPPLPKNLGFSRKNHESWLNESAPQIRWGGSLTKSSGKTQPRVAARVGIQGTAYSGSSGRVWRTFSKPAEEESRTYDPGKTTLFRSSPAGGGIEQAWALTRERRGMSAEPEPEAESAQRYKTRTEAPSLASFEEYAPTASGTEPGRWYSQTRAEARKAARDEHNRLLGQQACEEYRERTAEEEFDDILNEL